MDERTVFQSYHFIFVKRLMMATFTWPYQNMKLKFYGRAFMIFAVHTMMIPQMIRFYEEWHKDEWNLQILIECYSGFLYFQIVLFKAYMNIFNEQKLKQLYEEMTKDYEEIHEPVERAAIVKLWNFARILSIIYASYMFTALFVFVFTPQAVPAIFDVIWPLNGTRPKMICYYAEYFIDQDEYLVYLVLHTFVVVGITLAIIASADTSFMTVSHHVLGLFNLLTFRLRQMNEWTDNDVQRNDERVHNFVIDTIKIHIKTIEFSKKIQLAYDKANFISVGVTLVGLSIGTINILMNLTNPEVLLRIGVLWLGVILYLFFMNWPGQLFLNSSEDLSKSIYLCNWYKLPVKTRFLLRFMMMRCLIPCQLTAGPLFQLNFANCGAILRTALSYFTTVYSLT